MLTLIKVTFVALLNFAYITIFNTRKIKKMSSDKAPLEARKILKEKLCLSLIKAAKIDLEVLYLDEKGYRKLKREDGIVVVANHQSNLDIPVLVAALDLPLGFVAKKEMENWPFYSMWMKMSKCIFLDRSNPREGIKSIKKAVHIVKEGYPTVIFPEGERTLTGEIGTFKKGSFKLATETEGIILPVTIDGTFFVQNRKNVKINPNQKVRVTVGKPIDLKKMYLENSRNLSEIVQELVANEKKVKNN
ncbi:MAG: lysophospholipid acyltransferase family protein [Cetobacterium sp.]